MKRTTHASATPCASAWPTIRFVGNPVTFHAVYTIASSGLETRIITASGEIVAERAPGVPVCLSVDVLPEIKEYERTSSTVINGYVMPIVARYLARAVPAGSIVRPDPSDLS